MGVTEGTKSIPFKIDSKFAFSFDELQNIKLSSRKSDTGFVEDDKMMISMRPGTLKVGDNIAGAGGVSNQFFFTDFFKNRWHLKAYNNNVRRLKEGNWYSIDTFVGNTINFNSIKLPLNVNSTISSTYVTPNDAISAETVVKDLSDTTINPEGKILIIVDDTNNNQIYRGVYAPILASDATTYTLEGGGISTILKNGASYQIYDTLGEYLQVCSGEELERYYFTDDDGIFIENTDFQGLATQNLRNIKAFDSNQYLTKELAYFSYYWVFNKGTLYYSAGYPNNPFFFEFSGALTIPGTKGGEILDLYLFKGRLVIGGTNFIAHFKGAITTDGYLDITGMSMLTSAYGMKANSLVDLGLDAYFISTNKKIYSLSETIAGTIIATNIGKIVNNYLKDFNYGICGGYDGENLFFYGQIDADTPGNIVVLDIEYKFWSTYTGLRPSTIVLENGDVYLSDNNSDTIRYFSSSTQTDTGTAIEQKASLRDIDLGDAFTPKILSDIYLWFDNYTQSLIVDTYMSSINGNAKKNSKIINITGVDVEGISEPIGENIVGGGIIGGFAGFPEATYPFMKHISYDADSANIWKIILTGLNGSPFYLNEIAIDIGFSQEQKSYFSANHTI